jgi:pimeloyl-ACP methyl ester carboxylesterase
MTAGGCLRRLAFAAFAAALAFAGLVATWQWKPGWIIEPLIAWRHWRAGLERKDLAVDGDRWPYLERIGGDGTPVVVVHGFGADANAMAAFATQLADRRVIVPDLPGFGEHPLPDGMVPWEEEYVARLASFLRALGPGPYDVIGSSMGGAVSGALAARHPELVASLVLIAPAGVPAERENDFFRRAREGENPLDIASVEDLDRVLATVFLRPPELPPNVKRWLVERNRPHRATRAAILATMAPFLVGGLEEVAPAIRAPTLVLWGDSDRVTDPGAGETLASLVPGARLVIVPQAGHVPWEEAPAATYGALRGFLAESRADPR